MFFAIPRLNRHRLCLFLVSLFFCFTFLSASSTQTPLIYAATPVSTVHVDLTTPSMVSSMSPGATHTQYSADASNNANAVASAKNILQNALTYQNQQIMGWGADDPEPSPGVYDWSSLDKRVQLMRTTHATMVLTFCGAPGWMRPAGYQDDWTDLATAPDPSHVQDFANLAAQIVLRYPDVHFFQVWNELKGMWTSDPGATSGLQNANRWDYVRYTTLYNAVYDAVKKVSPGANIGGPYIVMASDGNKALMSNPGPTYPWGTLDQRPLDALSYWLQNKHGADFITVDASSTNTDNVWDTDEFTAGQKFADVVHWIRQQSNGGTTLPIWWAEWYAGDPTNAPVNLDYDNALIASDEIIALQSGVTVPLLWQPQGDAQGFSMPEGLWTDTRVAGGGQPTPYTATSTCLKQYFGPGTQLYKTTVSTPSLSALASSQEIMLVNHVSTTQPIIVDGVSMSLAPYQVQCISLPTLPPLTDPGITDDTNPTPGNVDQAGNSYSMQALQKTPIQSSFVEGGLQFTWPKQQYTDALSNGQTLPINNGTSSDVALGLIGSATNGAITGTATITYDDGTTQPFQLGFSDWTLGGGTLSPAYGNKVASAQLYRNTQHGKQNVKTFLFFTSVALQGGKKALSITMPTLAGKDQLHLFTWSTTSSHAAEQYNNVSSTDDAYTRAGSFDNAGNSYSRDSMPWAPGEAMNANSSDGQFIAPDVPAGTFDNYTAAGQIIPFAANGQSFADISFAGAASNGPSSGTASVNYTDGTKQAFTLSLSDWTLNGGAQLPLSSNQPLWTSTYRNTPRGQQTLTVYLFQTTVQIQTNKIVQSVTLPATTNQGKLHIFSMTLQHNSSLNLGSTKDAAPLFGNLDGSHHSYSEDALAKAGIPLSPSGSNIQTFSFHGSAFHWMSSNGLNGNNTIADGQTVSYQGDAVANATKVTLIGSATNGSSSGTGTISYTDGTTSTYTLSLTDWCASTPQFGNLTMVALPYRNTTSGRQTIANNVYYAEVVIDPTKTLQSITLPKTTGGQMHIFDTSYRLGP